MNKRFWICAVVMFFASTLLAFVVHAGLLGSDYQSVGELYRDAEGGRRHFPWMLLSYALSGVAMTWLFTRGFSRKSRGIAQGVRFGMAMACLSTIPGHLLHYAVQPMPPALVLKQIVFGTLSMLLLGALLAWLQPHRDALALPD